MIIYDIIPILRNTGSIHIRANIRANIRTQIKIGSVSTYRKPTKITAASTGQPKGNHKKDVLLLGLIWLP